MNTSLNSTCSLLAIIGILFQPCHRLLCMIVGETPHFCCNLEGYNTLKIHGRFVGLDPHLEEMNNYKTPFNYANSEKKRCFDSYGNI